MADNRSGVTIVTDIAIEMRASIIALAGERAWTETRARWLERAARSAGISFRSAKALFYCEDRESRASTVEKVRRAVEAQKQEEANARAETRDILERIRFLEERLAQVDQEFFEQEAQALRSAAHQSQPSQD
jgi:molybdenum-dependent DNA-binding transcriptional regulator ModE